MRPRGNRYWREVVIKINAPSTITEGRCRYCGLVSSPLMEHRETGVRLCKVTCYFLPWVRKITVEAMRKAAVVLEKVRRPGQAETDAEVLAAIRQAISKEWWSLMNLHALYDKPVSEVLEVLDRAIELDGGKVEILCMNPDDTLDGSGYSAELPVELSAPDCQYWIVKVVDK